MIGSKHGHETIVELLCTNQQTKCNVNQTDNDGNTALFYACLKGHLGCVKCLLRHKSNSNQRNIVKKTPLMLTCSVGFEDIADYLLTNEYDKVDINLLNQLKQNEFMLAAEAGHLNILMKLIDFGASIHQQDIYGRNSLMYAASKGYIDTVQYLVRMNKDLVNIEDAKGDTALIHSCKAGHIKCVKELVLNGAMINHQNKDSETSLMHASLGNHCDVVKLLCAKGALLNITDRNQETALMWTCHNECFNASNVTLENCSELSGQLQIGSWRDYSKCVHLLVSNGAQLDKRDRNNESVLFHAIRGHHHKVIKYLCINGIDVDMKNKFDKTPLMVATELADYQTLETLLIHDAKVDDRVICLAKKKKYQQCADLLIHNPYKCPLQNLQVANNVLRKRRCVAIPLFFKPSSKFNTLSKNMCPPNSPPLGICKKLKNTWKCHSALFGNFVSYQVALRRELMVAFTKEPYGVKVEVSVSKDLSCPSISSYQQTLSQIREDIQTRLEEIFPDVDSSVPYVCPCESKQEPHDISEACLTDCDSLRIDDSNIDNEMGDNPKFGNAACRSVDHLHNEIAGQEIDPWFGRTNNNNLWESVPTTNAVEKYLNKVSKIVTDTQKLKNLGLALGLKHHEIEAIKTDNPQHITEAAYALLIQLSFETEPIQLVPKLRDAFTESNMSTLFKPFDN